MHSCVVSGLTGEAEDRQISGYMHGPNVEMLRRVAIVRTDVSAELSVSFIRVTRIDELGTTLAVTSNRCTLRRNTECCTRYWYFFAACVDC
jgi:hypothetical protein